MEKAAQLGMAAIKQREKGEAPVSVLLRDDAFCMALMQHRSDQGVRLPDVGEIPAKSSKLAYLQALKGRDLTQVAEARKSCDGEDKIREILLKLLEIAPDFLGEAQRELLKQPRPNADLQSYWAGLPLLLGSSRIYEASHPLFDGGTSDREAFLCLCSILARDPDQRISINDEDEKTGARNTIEIGAAPRRICPPEMGGVSSGTNAGIYHYEIDHPGGEFIFFSCLWPETKHLETVIDSEPFDERPGYYLMARNSYYLQEIGAFCLHSGDTQVTFLNRDGIVTGAVGHDLRSEAKEILAALEARGVEGEDLTAMRAYLDLGAVSVLDDDLCAVVECLHPLHMDLLGDPRMEHNGSNTYGAPRATLEALYPDGFEASVGRYSSADLPAGRLHLYVPNIASPHRRPQGIEALDRAVGRESSDLWFVLSDRELDLGDDPHLVTTMRRLAPPVVEVEVDL